MLVTGFVAGPWGTNCWVVAPGPGSECVVIDPGMDALQPLADLVAEHRLKPVAVLVSHGHIDHMWSVTPIADGYEIPALITAADRPLLAHPENAVSAQARAMIDALGGKFVEPRVLREVSDQETVEIAGLTFQVAAAPGHTPGSAAFFLRGDQPRMFSGDLLFQGSIGRTDLPGGDHQAMLKSLTRVVLPAAPETLVHCGHGPDTTISQELQHNPYLRGLGEL